MKVCKCYNIYIHRKMLYLFRTFRGQIFDHSSPACHVKQFTGLLHEKWSVIFVLIDDYTDSCVCLNPGTIVLTCDQTRKCALKCRLQ